MDALSDLLHAVKLSGAVYFRGDLHGAFAVELPPPSILLPIIKGPSAAGHRMVLFHIVRSGTGVVLHEPEVAGELRPGDLLIITDDHPHTLCDRPGRTPIPAEKVLPYAQRLDAPPVIHFGDRDIPGLEIICGCLTLVDRGFNPLLAALPGFLHMRSSEGPPAPWLDSSLAYTIVEAEAQRPGSGSLLARLSELLFIETVRAYLLRLPEDERGWLAALRDPAVGKALDLIHGDVAHPWTVAELARRVGVSRSALSARFSELLDQPPMQYLTQWRIQCAQSAMERDPQLGIAELAARVGYESEAAFNRAFKRITGQPPGRWREQQRG